MTSRPPNVLIVTVDCLRRDRISAYGYERRTTPFLDGLLDGSLHATAAHSTSSWTTPAVASMLTGLYPHRHGAGFIPGDPADLDADHLPTTLRGDVPTLPGLLRGTHRTGVFSAIWMTQFGLGAPGDFDERRQVDGASAPTMLSEVGAWIEGDDAPFFAWVHVAETHDPLVVEKRFRAFGPIEHPRRARRWAFTKRSDDAATPAFERYRFDRTALYDAATLAADTAIGEFWEGLPARTRDATILVVSADHGEELWEHRDEEIASFEDPRGVAGVGHGQNLWQEILSIPLIVHGPGIDARAVDAATSLADVAPTVLRATGAGVPSDLDGRSLLEPRESAERVVLAEGIAYGHQKSAVISGRHKLLSSPGDGYEQLFRLDPAGRETPAEGHEADEGVVARLRAAIPAERTSGPDSVVSEEGREGIEAHLRGLGYIE